MLKNFFNRIVGSDSDRALGRLGPMVERCTALEPDYIKLTDAELRAKTDEFRARIKDGTSLDDLMPEAFAAVREASRRVNNMRHYDVQLVGGALLHQGKIAEMRTGEGKTLVATAPLYLNALLGEGAHLVTQNDYLAKRDAQWMGRAYHALGLSTGIIQSAGEGRPDDSTYVFDPNFIGANDSQLNLKKVLRREAYACDITYGTNNEYGFDYLRDNMTQDLAECVQRVRKDGQPLLYFAVVDEVDNLLIDEARTPLIISGPADEPSPHYAYFAQWVRHLQRSTSDPEDKNPNGDYVVDVKSRNVTLTEQGIHKTERMLNVENLYASGSAEMLPYLDNALRASVIHEKDRDYVVSDQGEIIIVDEFTGRLMYGRRFSEGLHQAIEAKEGVKIQRESLTYATITFQNFFRMYEKLGGMTGTAMTESEEFFKIYNLEVVPLPTHLEFQVSQKKLVEKSEKFVDGKSDVKVFIDPKADRKFYKRLDYPDLVYKNEQVKYKAVVDEIVEVHATGRPILVGTIAIETSEQLSRQLVSRNIAHQTLNAKQHEKEAVIIAQAGRPGEVTIATNMAGRGVDILLGGNAEGIARDEFRRQGRDLTEVPPEEWKAALTRAEAKCKADKEIVSKLGGLHVIGTERHEARRIDNQLRGRCSRQGDPGSTRFFVSLDDELMRRFGGERVKGIMDRLRLEEDVPMEYGMLSKSIEQAQEKVEGYNFDMRKHVIQYDDVINKQREVIYAQRRTILEKADLKDVVLDMVDEEIEDLVKNHISGEETEDWDVLGLANETASIVSYDKGFDPNVWKKGTRDEVTENIKARVEARYEAGLRESAGAFLNQAKQGGITLNALDQSRDIFGRSISIWAQKHLDRESYLMLLDTPLAMWQEPAASKLPEIFFDALRLVRDRSILIQTVDQLWVRHLTDLEELREGIGLRAYGQRDPLVAYRTEASATFDSLIGSIRNTVSHRIFNVTVNNNSAPTNAEQTPQKESRTPAKQGPQRKMIAREAQKTTTAPAPVAQAPSPVASSNAPMQKINTAKPGRNETCPYCNSGKKLKHCNCESAKRSNRES